MDSSVDMTQCTSPLDAMYLIHKALRAEAAHVEDAVEHLEVGGSFKPFQRIFYRWALGLGYHVESEDQHLTTWIADGSLAAEQEAGHKQMMERLEHLQTYLHDEIGRTIVIPRTQRQLRGKVIALRILQDDLLEAEEEAILPLLRHRLSNEQQWGLMQHLLIDTETAEIVDWIAPALTAPEQQWLAELMVRFQTVSA
jgi:hypothetical protein